MIKFNLTPEEELKNPWWYFPDIAMFLVVFLVAYFGIQFYLDAKEASRQSIVSETESINAKIAEAEVVVKELEQTKKEIESTQNLIDEIVPLTSSQITRYMPLIVLEHLQNLKPEGVWFKKISFGTATVDQAPVPAAAATPPAGQTPPPAPGPAAPKPAPGPIDLMNLVEIEGAAFDNMLIAEFLTSLRATQNHNIDPADPRTHIYFAELNLQESKLTASTSITGSFFPPKAEPDMFPEFKLALQFSKREGATDLAQMKTALNPATTARQ